MINDGTYRPTGLNDLVGRHATGVRWHEDRLTIETAEGPLSFEVDGDCCSYSYFHDFYGVDHLLHGYEVLDVNEHELQKGDPGWHDPDKPDDGDFIEVYGYRLTVDHPLFGAVTAVFSFRNRSNGYYGGSLEKARTDEPIDDQVALTGDVVGEE